jgi:uncharacterized Zn finger protein
MSFYGWRPYVPVAARRQQAEREVAKLKKKGQSVVPVAIAGRNIATSFWGKAWCSNLECYSDYANRLPRGRTYVRNGSVVDLQIAKGEVTALVAGSSLYRIKIAIAPVKEARWKAICRDCAGSVDSLVELLQGRFEKAVMDRVCRKGDGLFPAPQEIKLSCSCPDWAGMCKHVAAALYGVGARLDDKPQLLFVLRGVDERDLIAGAGGGLPLPKTVGRAKVLDESDVAAVFGLEMDAGATVEPAGTQARSGRSPTGGRSPTAVAAPPRLAGAQARKTGKAPARRAGSNDPSANSVNVKCADSPVSANPSGTAKSVRTKPTGAKSAGPKRSKIGVAGRSADGVERHSSTICPPS